MPYISIMVKHGFAGKTVGLRYDSTYTQVLNKSVLSKTARMPLVCFLLPVKRQVSQDQNLFCSTHADWM